MSSTRFTSTSGDTLRKDAMSSRRVIVPVSSVSAFRNSSLSFPTSPLSIVFAMVINIVFFMNPNLVYCSISSMLSFTLSFIQSSMGPSAFFALTTFSTCVLIYFARASLSKDGGGTSSLFVSSSHEELLHWLPVSSSTSSFGRSCGCTNSGFLFFLTSASHASQILSTSGAHVFCRCSRACLAVQRSFGSTWRHPLTNSLALGVIPRPFHVIPKW
mmetsp:Transcript_12419/g.30348  ORF Transcript_12419/g.30348 Transcript_12419/m.30348 type:complete len:215 (+) Transcript_12419:529-1173(+)